MDRALARRGKRGSANVRELIDARGQGQVVDPTVLERKGRAILARCGLATPIAQYPIPWDPKRRFDDAYPSHRIAIEWDSAAWHSQVAAMSSDRRRDREAALHGWVIVRFTWDDVSKRSDDVGSTVAGLLAARSA